MSLDKITYYFLTQRYTCKDRKHGLFLMLHLLIFSLHLKMSVRPVYEQESDVAALGPDQPVEFESNTNHTIA